MSYTVIESLLNPPVQAIATTFGVQLVTENLREASTNNQPWIRTTLIPANNASLELGPHGADQWNGIFQVDYMQPYITGTTGARAAQDAFMQAFKVGTRLVDGTTGIIVQVMDPPSAMGARMFAQTFTIYSVKVIWVAFINR